MKMGYLRGAAVAAALAFGSAAHAAPITGGLTFGGAWQPTGGTGIADASGVDVLGNVASVTCALSTSCSGSYSSLTGAIAATYNDFTFNPVTPAAPLWTFTVAGITYSFNLVTITIDTQDANGLLLLGTGKLNITGFDETDGVWSFSGDTTQGGQFAFSSTSDAPLVPEPGSLALLGLGLIGLAAARRRKA